MAIVTTITTVSSRYYTKRGKDFTLNAIIDMRRQLQLAPLTAEERSAWRGKYADELAREALRLHDLFPE